MVASTGSIGPLPDTGDGGPRRSTRLRVSLCSLVAMLFWAPVARGGTEWRIYRDCELMDNASNDGDSFHVKYQKRHYLFRLCFVDAPETESSIPERVKEQGEYWDIDEKATLRTGREAAKFTRNFLKDGFTVYTRFKDARGRSDRKRYYAMVQVGDEYLSMALVEQGLARIYGYRVELPDGMKSKKYRAKLQSAERRAKREGRGAWGSGRSRPGIRIPEVEEQDVVLPRSVAVYSLDKSPRLLAILPRGKKIHVLGAESAFNLRVSFDHEGETREGKCRRTEVGI